MNDVKGMQKELSACVTQIFGVAEKVQAFRDIVVEIKNDNKESHKRFWDSHERDLAQLKDELVDKIKVGDQRVQIWALVGVVGLLINIVFQLWKR